ncbi:hypothetical protein M8J75_014813, partial [Diaphorina citri]
MESMQIYLVCDVKECCPAFLSAYGVLPVLRLQMDTEVIFHLASSK